MSILNIFFISVGLAMDAFSVAISYGASSKEYKIKQAIKMAVFFGLFQAGMPVMGWFFGKQFEYIISTYGYWLAFIILLIIGVKMIYESFKKDDLQNKQLNFYILTGLAVATSIDALVVGLSFAFLQSGILLLVILAGVITFFLSLVGYGLGNKLYKLLGNRAKLIGGIILILIGVKILFE